MGTLAAHPLKVGCYGNLTVILLVLFGEVLIK